MLGMVRRVCQIEVLRVVSTLVLVLMVDMLVGRQPAPKLLFHDEPMLSHHRLVRQLHPDVWLALRDVPGGYSSLFTHTPNIALSYVSYKWTRPESNWRTDHAMVV